MIRALFFVALAFAAVSAQRWPMITVNAAGEIVLQSLTRAQSFQVTPAAVTTAPSSSGSPSATTATALTAGVSAFVVTTITSPVAGHGVTLPTPTVGASVVLLQSQSTFVSYTIWTSSSSVFVNSDSSFVTLIAVSRRVSCQAVSTTRWNCVQDGIVQGIKNVITTTTPTIDQAGSLFYGSLTGTAGSTTAATTLTLPQCTLNFVGSYFEIHYDLSTSADATPTAGKATFTIARTSTDTFRGSASAIKATNTASSFTAASASATSASISITSGATAANSIFGSVSGTATCVSTGVWAITLRGTAADVGTADGSVAATFA